MRDPYDVLGVNRSASEAEVKRAYRKLAKENHPDRHAGDPKAQAKFAEINNAYEIVGDKEKRGKFDRGEIDAEGKPSFQGFEGFRGGQGGAASRTSTRAPSPTSSRISAAAAEVAAERALSASRAAGPGGARASQGGGFDRGRPLINLFGGLGGRQRASRHLPARRAPTSARDVAVTLEDIAEGRKPKVSLPTGKTVRSRCRRASPTAR